MNVILKTVERCNINCSYCYFFNGADPSFARHPALMDRETIAAVASFLADGVVDLGIRSLSIAFHGGEPMLQRKSEFDWMCQHLRRELESRVDLRLGIQTNGMLVDNDWIDLFAAHNVGVGVSVDGPKHIHDRYRVDHSGRGTYDRTVAGIESLQRAVRTGVLRKPIGALAVINPETDAKEVFNHLVDDLGFRVLHWELPDTHLDMAPVDASAYGRYLCELFDTWVARDDPELFIRIFASFLIKLSGLATPLFPSNGDWQASDSQLREITVASNGDLGLDDALRQTGYWTSLPAANVRRSSLASFIGSDPAVTLAIARTRVPDSCGGCLWEHACGGGSMVNRWSSANGFNNSSVYCASLKSFFAHAVAYLTGHGIPLSMIGRSLVGDAIVECSCGGKDAKALPSPAPQAAYS